MFCGSIAIGERRKEERAKMAFLSAWATHTLSAQAKGVVEESLVTSEAVWTGVPNRFSSTSVAAYPTNGPANGRGRRSAPGRTGVVFAVATGGDVLEGLFPLAARKIGRAHV
jgi:hypothetical protein